MHDLSSFGPKDRKIIKENEGKTPHDLLLLGLSDKAYNRLIEQEETEAKAPTPKAKEVTDEPITPAKVEKVHKPHVAPLPQAQPQAAGTFQTVQIKTATGTQTMNRQLAERMAAQYPNDFQIVQ